MYLELLAIMFALLIGIFTVNFLFFHFMRSKKIKPASEDIRAICNFIGDGTKKVIKSISKLSYGFLFLISLILLIQMAIVDFIYLPVLLLISGFVSSLYVNKLAARLLQKNSASFFVLLQDSKLNFFKFILAKGRYVLTAVMCLVVVDFFLHFLILDFLFSSDVMHVKQAVNDVFLAGNISHVSEVVFFGKVHEFKLHILILLFFHFLGYVTQTIISCLYSSYFGSASDVGVDISSFLNYDFYEDDIRNPAILADFVGDFLKKSFKLLNVISCFAIGILLSVSYFVSYFYLENLEVISDVIFNHVISSFIIFTIGVIVYFLASLYLPRYITNFKSITMFSLKRFGLGLVVSAIAIWCFFYFEPTIDSSNVLFIFLGMCIQLIFYWIIMFHYKAPKHELKSIFSYIVYGVFRGSLLFFILTFTWVGFLAFIYFVEGVNHVRCDILNLNYFLMGFFIQLFFCLGDYLGLNFIDSSSGIRKILNLESVSEETISFFQQYRLRLEMVIKNSICFMGIMFLVSIMFFYYQRLIIIMHFVDDGIHIDSNLLTEKVQNVSSYFKIGIQNLSFDIGLILGVLAAVGFLILFVYGFYLLYRSLVKNIESQMAEFELIQAGKKMPEYMSIITELNSKLLPIILGVLAAVLGVPYFVSKFFSVAGVIGVMFSLFFILFIIAGLGINVGSYWSYLKLSFNQNIDSEENVVIKTNMVFCDNLGDMLKDLLGVSLVIISLGVLCYFILFIPSMFNLT